MDKLECKYNEGLKTCTEAGSKCKKCGWNPEVSKKRLDKIKQPDKGK